MALNATAGAARTHSNAVDLEVIRGKIRPIRNDTLLRIDRRLCSLGMYEKVDLHPFLETLRCWDRTRVVNDLRQGLPSGDVMLWTWMPGGSRAGIAAHVVWKVFTRCHYQVVPKKK